MKIDSNKNVHENQEVIIHKLLLRQKNRILLLDFFSIAIILVTCIKRELQLQHYGVYVLSSPHYPQPYASHIEHCVWIFHVGYPERNVFHVVVVDLFLDEFDQLMIGNTSAVMTNTVRKFPPYSNIAPKAITLRTSSMWVLFSSGFQRKSHKFYFIINAYNTSQVPGNVSI